MPLMRAKFRVTDVVAHGTPTHYENVRFAAVSRSDGYPEDGSDENNSYARWTPSASLEMTITNPYLFGQIKPEQEFYVDFTPAQ